MLIKASARKVLFRDESNEESPDLVAAGVEFDHGGTMYTVQARKEVILSAGYPLFHLISLSASY